MRNEAKRKRESVEGERSKRGFVREEKKEKLQSSSGRFSLSQASSMSAPPCAERMKSGFVTANDGVELAYSLWRPEGAQLG